MASRVRLSAPNPEAAEPELPPPALTSDLLEEIFLRVASPADLARPSAACVSFRRLIADHSFLRRYHSIHPPVLLGFIGYSGCFRPLQAPHPSAAVSRAVARATDFSFDYVPLPTTESCWHSCDVRNGRVLIGCRGEEGFPAYWDLAVCDPVSRGYLLLPPITDDLLTSVGLRKQNIFHTGAFFIPSGGIEDTSFSVIFWMQSETRLGVFVFSSVSSCWSVSMSTNGDALGLNSIDVVSSGQCMYDCFYWKLCHMSTLIKLDMNTMQFCTVDLPPGHNSRRIVIVESGENKLAMFSLLAYGGTSVDYYTFSQNEWHMMNTIPLPTNNCMRLFKGPVEGYIFIEGITIEEDATEFFSLEIKSFNIERLTIAGFTFSGHPYFGFPPSMSQILIQGYGELQD